MKKTEKVSVIIPLFNARPYLAKTVESVRQQKFTDWKLYLIDDCSDDGSQQIATSLAKQYPDKIIYYRQDKRASKPSVGKNKGIALSQGEFIAFLDHDDWWLPEHLELLVRELDREPGTVMAGTNGYFFSQEKNKILGTYRPPHERMSQGQRRLFTLSAPPYLTSSCMMVRRELFTQLGSPDESLGMSDDHELAIRVVADGRFQIAIKSEPTVVRRWLSDSFSNSPEAMKLIIKDVETIYQRYANSPGLSVAEKEQFRHWRWRFRKRWGNYLLSEGYFKEAKQVYREVVNKGEGGSTLKAFYLLSAIFPGVARAVVSRKRTWSLQHPDVIALS